MADGFASWFVGLLDTFWTMLFYGWPFLLLGVIFINKMMWRRFPIEAVIIEKRGENLIKTNDRVGKFYDRHAETTAYRLQKSKDTIPVYNFDWVLHNVSVPTTLMERYINIVRGNVGTIFLFRYGSKQYKPINLKPVDGVTKKLVQTNDQHGEPIFIYQYEQFDPRKMMGALDFEVIDWDNMNFMVQEQRASIIRRQKKGEFWKQTLIPLAIIGASVVVAIFILKFSMDAGESLRGTVASGSNGNGGSKIGGAINDAFTPGE